MEKIKSVEIFDKDGERFVRYVTVNSKGAEIVHERPYFLENGEIDPEVDNLLNIASKQGKEGCMVSGSAGNVVVYDVPENATVEKEGFFSKNKKIIASGLVGILIGVGIMALAKSCDSQKTTVPTDLEQDDIMEENQETIVYVTEEEFVTGVTELKKHLKDSCNYDASLTDLYSFYYVCNFENVSNDLFSKFVEDGMIPDRDVSILGNMLNVTGTLADLNTKAGKSVVDYGYVFVDEDSKEQAEYWQAKNNAMTTATKEEAQLIMDELNSTWVSPDTGIALGTKEIVSLIDANNIVYKATTKGISYSPALWNAITDVSTLAASIDQQFTCATVNEAGKQLTK